jgi:GxxExxY protein
MEIEEKESALTECSEELINITLDCVFKDHSVLGPGLLESVYEYALAHELELNDIPFRRQFNVPVKYKDIELPCGFRADFLVGYSLLLELKSVEQINNLHIAQMINYLKLLKIKRGFLLNFNVKLMKHGTRRISI